MILPIEPSLQLVARRFIELQDQRIVADYDTRFVADESWTRNAIRFALTAALEWRKVKGSANANVFLTALAFHRLWTKGA